MVSTGDFISPGPSSNLGGAYFYRDLYLFFCIFVHQGGVHQSVYKGGEMRSTLVFLNYLYQQHLLLICNGKNNSFLRFL